MYINANELEPKFSILCNTWKSRLKNALKMFFLTPMLTKSNRFSIIRQ